ncbi:MAG: MFS transporter [Bacillota bacterium]|nr:MFS transporter [Bacillota bacterium]
MVRVDQFWHNLTARVEARREKASYRWLTLFVVLVGVFMANLDGSIVNVALPTISAHLRADLTVLQWVVTGYLLTISSSLLLFGRLADLIGRGRVYSWGVLVFVLGSALCGLAPNVWLLIAFRVVQAAGAAMEMANSMGIITDVFPVSERGRALGLVGTAVAAGSLAGPPLGGWLVGAFGWRSIFYINLPIGLLAFLAGLLLLPNQETLRREAFDLPGAALFSGGMVSLLLWLSEGREWGWRSPLALGALALAAGLLLSFVFWERRVPSPLLDLSLFRNRLFTAGNLAGMLSYVVMFFVNILVPFYLHEVLGFRPAQVGLLMTPMPAAMVFLAPLAGWLSDLIGPVLLTTAGMAIIAAAQVAMAFLPATATYWDVAWRLFLLGAGMALFTSPNNSAVMGAAPRAKYGVAGGVVATVRNVGMSLGVAMAVAIFSARMAQLEPLMPERARAFVLSLRAVYLVGAAIAAAGIAVASVRNVSYQARKAGEGVAPEAEE